MGRKGGKYKKKESNEPVKEKAAVFHSDDEDMMNDEIDAFHKQRDVVPLDMNDDSEESDEDNVEPVFDIEDDEDEDEDDEDDKFEDDDKEVDTDDEDDKQPKGLAAKIIKTQKYMQSKFGRVEDDILEDQEEEEQPRIWKKFHGADVDNELLSSDDEDYVDEEAEVLRLQSEKTKALSLEDFGLEEAIEKTEKEASFKEMMDAGKLTSNSLDEKIKDDQNIAYEVVKKDLNSLTKEEQMNAVYSSAPELVGLLSELKDALEQLENRVNPLLNKIKGQESAKKGGMHFIKVKQLLLQSFCQAIAFYLLLKSEGLSVCDHPVVSRLVDIKSLLDKMDEMEGNIPFAVEEILNRDLNDASVVKLGEETAVLESDSLIHDQDVSFSSEEHPNIEISEAAELNSLKTSKAKESECKPQVKHVRPQSMEMLKHRAALEEKLKQTGGFSLIAKNVSIRKNPQPMNRQLETLDDFDDEVVEIDRVSRSRRNGLLSLHPKKRKVVLGDDDIPKRDDIGERRWKHELRVMAGAGIKPDDDIDDDVEAGNVLSHATGDANEGSDPDSASEYYELAEKLHTAKIAAKSKQHSSTIEAPDLPETTVEGKRLITRQIEKNRGLTRHRNKAGKNPRKKYRNKHISAEIRRKGQVPAVVKPTGPYGGEASGINPLTSRSRRF